jgi:hypothetical protein
MDLVTASRGHGRAGAASAAAIPSEPVDPAHDPGRIATLDSSAPSRTVASRNPWTVRDAGERRQCPSSPRTSGTPSAAWLRSLTAILLVLLIAGACDAGLPNRTQAAATDGPIASSTGDSIDAPGSVVFYVRVAGSRSVWVAMTENGDRSRLGTFQGPAKVGGGCTGLPAGSSLVVLDRDPSKPDAVVLATVLTQGTPAEPAVRWIDVSVGGEIVVGSGVPAWWSGPPLESC